jgi:hypothetical protein
MVSILKNYKLIFFEVMHHIIKLTDSVETSLGLDQDLGKTPSGPAQDPART